MCCFIKPYHLLYMEKYKKPYKYNTFKIAPAWNEEIKFPNGSYSVSDIQHYCKYIFKKNMRQLPTVLRK